MDELGRRYASKPKTLSNMACPPTSTWLRSKPMRVARTRFLSRSLRVRIASFFISNIVLAPRKGVKRVWHLGLLDEYEPFP